MKAIRTEEDHRAALARIEELWGAAPDSPQFDELEVLLALVASYEKKRHSLSPPDPVAMLEYRLDQMGVSSDEIERLVASRHRITEILSREIGLSTDMIENLFDLPLRTFVGDTAETLSGIRA